MTPTDQPTGVQDDVGDWKDVIKDVVRLRHRSFAASALARLAKTYLRAYYNENHYRLAYNGEGFVLETLRKVMGNDQIVAFDVGAHAGTWAYACQRYFPLAQIHCFEIAPPTYATLERNTRGQSQFHINCLGLSSSERSLTLSYSENSTTTTNVYQPTSGATPTGGERLVEVQVTTGDKYAAEHAIERIDLLKIDTEGHDLDVLKGFSQTLQRKPIPLIQFEFGFVHIPARNVLEDFYLLLQPFGYTLGRLHPGCVEFKEYDPREDENFRMGNYIAVPKSEPALISALRGRWAANGKR